MKTDEFSPWQCFVLRLTSIQETANNHKLSLIFNAKSILKINMPETSFN